MAAYDSQRSQFALQNMRRPLCAIIMIDPVKAIPSNSAFEPLVWSRINSCSQRQAAVKSSIEDRYLLDSWEELLDEFNALQPHGVVKWCDRGNVLDRLLH